ncbi:MAG TPA: AAA family ATPase [Rhizomicrobium sp.]|nr:AAA family ATPase [Rhizomicrobium sp.]
MTPESLCQSEAIAFLARPSTYGSSVSAVEQHETHGAIVFLAGDRAYKLKRAVHYPYMDYSSPEVRRAMCEAELAVNCRTAQQLYLDVLSIVREATGTLRFGARDEAASAVDWVVVMRRFPQRALLEQMRLHGQLTPPLMRNLAESIATFHMSAEVKREFGGAPGIQRVIEENAAVLRSSQGQFLGDRAVEVLDCGARRVLADLAALLEERRTNGFVRRCHGDLHLNNICLLDGQPVLFDAVEFSEDFSCIDVLYDLAFLLMDLEHRGLRAFTNMVLNRYLEITRDYGGVAALPLFLSCRAAIRAHVAGALAENSTPAQAQAVCSQAHALLREAIGYLSPARPRLVVIGGLSGTGKTTVARTLAPTIGKAPGAIVLRSDVIRKHLCGVPELERLPATRYDRETTRRVYSAIAATAGLLLRGGHSVIADAVYGWPGERAEIEAAARNCGAAFLPIWLTAPVQILEERIGARRGDASDATVEVLHRQVESIEGPTDWHRVDAGGSEESSRSQLDPIVRA